MRLRRPIAFILSAALAASALTGCDSFSGHAAAAANSAQVQQLIEFIADLGLERDLRQALQSGGDLRQALLTLLGLENAVNFNVNDLAGARPGQHAVQVWEVTAQSAEDAAALAASQIRAVLEQLRSNGVTAGRIGMVEVDGKYYVVVDVEVTEENTFEPIRPASDDDDSEDTPSASAPTATVGGMTIDLSSLDNNISADEILKLAGENYTEDAITELDLSGCTSITSISGFDYCENLKEVNLSGCTNLTSIGNNAFYSCDGLTEVNLSGCTNLTSIGNNAFYSCDGLTEINLGDCTNLTSIGSYAFMDCDSLEEINLSGCTSLDTINSTAFRDCRSLTSINLSGCINLKSIVYNAFQNCASLETITLPSTVTTIGEWAFANSGLTEINLGNTQVDTINNRTFYNCSGLKTVKLPAKLTTISGWAFEGCSSLTDITFYSVPNTIETNAFYDVITDDRTLTIHCPSSCDIDKLKIQLKNGGLAEGTYTLDNNLNPAAYLLGL